jgi:prepilin-type N-terminal cleavage/methylation domain-containing protein
LKRLKNKKGFSFLELVIAMAIMGLLGTMVVGLVKTGLTSSGRIRDDMSSETEARAALSLITVQLRRHDATGAIRIDTVNEEIELLKNPNAAPPAHLNGTVISYGGGDVYAQDTTDVSGPVSTAGLTPIARVVDVAVTFDLNDAGTAITYDITVTYGAPGNLKELKQTVTQRSNPAPASPGP